MAVLSIFVHNSLYHIILKLVRVCLGKNVATLTYSTKEFKGISDCVMVILSVCLLWSFVLCLFISRCLCHKWEHKVIVLGEYMEKSKRSYERNIPHIHYFPMRYSNFWLQDHQARVTEDVLIYSFSWLNGVISLRFLLLLRLSSFFL
jgi:hypothetical protein